MKPFRQFMKHWLLMVAQGGVGHLEAKCKMTISSFHSVTAIPGSSVFKHSFNGTLFIESHEDKNMTEVFAQSYLLLLIKVVPACSWHSKKKTRPLQPKKLVLFQRRADIVLYLNTNRDKMPDGHFHQALIWMLVREWPLPFVKSVQVSRVNTRHQVHMWS